MGTDCLRHHIHPVHGPAVLACVPGPRGAGMVGGHVRWAWLECCEASRRVLIGRELIENVEVEKMSGTTHMMVEQLRKLPLSIDVIKQVRNWGTYLSDYLGLLHGPSVEYQLRNETRFLLRPGTADRTIFNDIWLRKLYCPESTLRPDDIVIDIGAHIGIFSLFAASCAARVFSFEPFPENFSLLKENIARNNFQGRVLPSPLAVWA